MQLPQGLFGNAGQQQQGYAQTGANVGRVIGRLFGLKDPVLERRTILSEVDYTDPTSMRTAAQKLMAQGDVDAGMQLAGQARQIEQQERTFGLESRKVAATEKELEERAADRAARLALSQKELDLKFDELNTRKDLTAAQVDKVRAEIKALGEGNYHIVEQKGGDLGTTTVGFIAINKRNPSDQRTISLVGGSVTPASATTPAAPAASGARPPLSSFGAPR